jgi:voltage-gated potassium channel
MITKNTARQRIYQIIERAESGDTASSIFDIFIIVLIVLNIAAVIASSFSAFYASNSLLLHRFEVISVIIFTIEYFFRLWTAPEKYQASKFPYIKYLFSFMALIDLFAILPFYLPFIIKADLRFLRILRLFRLLRLFKLNRYNNSMELFIRVFKNEKDKILMTSFVMGIMLIVSASIMYHVENVAQPEAFPNIIATIWWAVATLTTVGYGDIYPVTILGKLLAGIIAILGIGLVALPTGIISSGFINELNHKKQICPHCGKEIRE